MKIDTGTLRSCLSVDLQKQCESIIEKKQHDPNYYMLIWSDVDKLDSNKIRTKIFTLYEDNLPSLPLLGTMCIYVDNKAGRVTTKWNLPLDIPTEGYVNSDEMVQEAGEYGMKMGWAIFNQ